MFYEQTLYSLRPPKVDRSSSSSACNASMEDFVLILILFLWVQMNVEYTPIHNNFRSALHLHEQKGTIPQHPRTQSTLLSLPHLSRVGPRMWGWQLIFFLFQLNISIEDDHCTVEIFGRDRPRSSCFQAQPVSSTCWHLNLMAGHQCIKQIGASLTIGFVVVSDRK